MMTPSLASSKSHKSPYLAQADLTLQLSSLRNTPTSSLPRSVYLLPSQSEPLLIDGVVFVGAAGPYAGAIFRFTLRWPSSSSSSSSTSKPKTGSAAATGAKPRSSSLPLILFDAHCVPAHPLIQPAAPHRLNLAPLLEAQHDDDDGPSSHSALITLPSLLRYLHQIFQPTYLRDVLALRPDWFTGYNVDVGEMLVKEYGNGNSSGKKGGQAQTQARGVFDSLARQSVRLSRSGRVLFGHGAAAGDEGEGEFGIVFPEALLGKSGGGGGVGNGVEATRKRDEWMAQLRRDIFYGDEEDGDDFPASAS